LPPPPEQGDLFAPPADTSVAEVSLHQIKMTVGPEFMALLAQVKETLAHAHPGASLETILAGCMQLALAGHARRARAATDKPRPTTRKTAPGSRHIPAAVRRAVWARDGGQCTFRSAEGRRCDSRSRLELHHEVPFANGGLATVEGIRLLCRGHNDLQARADFGDAHMDQFARTRPAE
jgi:5-methylcytosine-specific restriction endonuclease McrA